MKIKILITDDHQLFREGMVNLLSDASNIEIVAHAENGKEAITKSQLYNPDIVLMDINMPIMNGVEATYQLKQKMPKIKVIALSMHSDKRYVKSMLEAGAFGYLFKNCTYTELINAIETVYEGRKYLGDEITDILIDHYIDDNKSEHKVVSELTERELEILKLYAEGKTTREIAEELFVSVKTVGTHKQHIHEKLNLKSNVDLIKYALKIGLISLD